MADVRRTHAVTPIGVAPALGIWAIAWIAGALAATPVLIVLAGGTIGGIISIPQLTIATAGMWIVFAVALVIASRRFGSGAPVADLALSFRPIDVVGVPVGIVTQFVLVPALYWPLRELWPDAFSQTRLEERAQDLADRAGGFDTVLLVLVVVVGAPLIEELVYRGLIQRSLTSAVGAAAGLGLTALLFALIHFSPVEYPGLFLAGAVFGACVVLTGRIGPAILTHAAFNAAGLVVVLTG